MTFGTGIEWTEATWNPTTGCDRISSGCDNCLDPDTPVLMADMSWRPIGKIAGGDEVVGFTENPGLGQNRLYERATVVHAWRTVAEAVEITVGGRTIVASIDHRFLAHARPYWREAERLTIHTGLIDIGMPAWLPDTESEPYLVGYLAGVIGGDGTFRIAGSGKNETKQSYLRVAVLASDQPILDRVVQAFNILGCTDIAIRGFDGGCSSPSVTDTGRAAAMAKVETRRIANLITIRDQCLPERDDPSWKAGFLAGFFDTDGCYSGKNLRFNQTKANRLLDVTHRYIGELGFRSEREDFRSASGRSERVVGDLEEKIRFLSTIQPVLTRKAGDFYGRRFPGKQAAKVDGIRRIGTRELVDIQTTSGTFIAAGIATHNCYALAMAKRLKAMGVDKYQHDGDPRTSGPGFGIAWHESVLGDPYRWSGSRLVFVNSMSDLFHAKVPLSFIRGVFEVMTDTPQHTYQLLTKRSRRLRRIADDLPWPPNVWIGVSVEDDRVLSRVDDLRQVPAGVRFLSCEPLLGPMTGLDLHGIEWVIAGGESGPRHRPMQPEWVRELRDLCLRSEVPFFFKQWGGRTPKQGGRVLDGRTWDEMPAPELSLLVER